MKIISPQLLFFVLLSTNVFSQQRLDSLKHYYTLEISENERYSLISKKVFNPLRLENPDSLVYFTKQIYELAKKTKNLEAISNAEAFMADAYDDVNNEAAALRHLYVALKGFETVGNNNRIVEICLGISHIYKKMEDHQKSFEFINRSMQLKDSLDGKDGYYHAALIHHANAAKELKDYKTAFKSAKTSLNHFGNFADLRVYNENNLGSYYLALFEESSFDSLVKGLKIKNRQQTLDSASYYYDEVLKSTESLESKKEINKWKAYVYTAKGKIAYLKENYSQSIEHLEKIKTISKDYVLFNDLLKRNHKTLYLSYSAIGDYEKALMHYQNFVEQRDKIQSDENKRALFKQDLVYKHEKELKVKEDNIAAKNRLIIIAIISSLVLLIIVVLLIKRRQLLKDKKSKEKFAHDLLMTQENERKRISEDLHDGLGQSLLFVKNEIVSKNHEKSKKLINSSIEEMRTIARSLYPFQLNNVGIVRAIDNLIVQLNDSTQGIYFFSEIEIKDDTLNTLQKVNTFRIVQECLSNIVKHAKGTSAKVSLTTKNKKVNIRIQDNGVGFNFSKKYSIPDTLGLKTIQERVNFLKGTLEIDSKKGQGTSFSIIFSIDT